MPELPEVEVVRRGLAAHVQDVRIRDVHVLHPRSVRRQAQGPGYFEAVLTGRTLTRRMLMQRMLTRRMLAQQTLSSPPRTGAAR